MIDQFYKLTRINAMDDYCRLCKTNYEAWLNIKDSFLIHYTSQNQALLNQLTVDLKRYRISAVLNLNNSFVLKHGGI